MDLIDRQPEERTEKRTETHACDLISRQAAIDAVRAMQTYKLHEGDDMLLVDKAEVQTELMTLPSAQSEEDCDTCKHGFFGSRQCDNCRVGYPSHYERRTE